MMSILGSLLSVDWITLMIFELLNSFAHVLPYNSIPAGRVMSTGAVLFQYSTLICMCVPTPQYIIQL